LHVRSVKAPKRWRTGTQSRAVAVDAIVFDEQFGPRLDRLRVIEPAEPLLIVALLHDDNAADHFGMIGPAVFCAEQMVCTGTCRPEPERPVFAWNRVLLDAQRRNKKAVDDILRGQSNLDCGIPRHMKLVDFASAFGMLNFPHPLFANDVHILRSAWWRFAVHIDFRSPDEHDDRDHERHSGPEKLQTN